MRMNGNTDMQLELALKKTTKNMVLVEDGDTKICWHNGQLKMHRPGSSPRRTTVNRLVKIAPANRIMEVLGEAC
jgi:hypothetical protein